MRYEYKTVQMGRVSDAIMQEYGNDGWLLTIRYEATYEGPRHAIEHIVDAVRVVEADSTGFDVWAWIVLIFAREISVHDDPALDATDFAHPAWWRGEQHSALVFCEKVNQILDGKDDGSGFGYEPWHATRMRLLELVNNPAEPKSELKELQDRIRSIMPLPWTSWPSTPRDANGRTVYSLTSTRGKSEEEELVDNLLRDIVAFVMQKSAVSDSVTIVYGDKSMFNPRKDKTGITIDKVEK